MKCSESTILMMKLKLRQLSLIEQYNNSCVFKDEKASIPMGILWNYRKNGKDCLQRCQDNLAKFNDINREQ